MRRCDPASEKKNLCPILNKMSRSAVLTSFSALSATACLHNVHLYVLPGSFSRFITEDFLIHSWLYKSSLLYWHHYFSTRSVLQDRIRNTGPVHLQNDTNEGERSGNNEKNAECGQGRATGISLLKLISDGTTDN